MIDGCEKPLAGKRIVVTRAPEHAGELIRTLEHMGAEIIALPSVGFESPEDSQRLDRALGALGSFDWALFTSQNAVRFVALRLEQLSLPPATRRVAAVGPATAEAARLHGFHVDYVATNHTAHSLAHELRDSLAGGTVFLPRSDHAGAQVAMALREGGAEVTDVVAYRTVAPEAPDQAVLDRIRDAEIDVTIFASPSAFHNLDGFLGAGELAKLAERVQFAAIGSTTAKAMRESGVRVHIEAEKASAAGLADAIAKYYHERPAYPRRV
jgi:uroporphyrinogen III methyltransferase/synthase